MFDSKLFIFMITYRDCPRRVAIPMIGKEPERSDLPQKNSYYLEQWYVRDNLGNNLAPSDPTSNVLLGKLLDNKDWISSKSYSSLLYLYCSKTTWMDGYRTTWYLAMSHHSMASWQDPEKVRIQKYRFVKRQDSKRTRHWNWSATLKCDLQKVKRIKVR